MSTSTLKNTLYLLSPTATSHSLPSALSSQHAASRPQNSPGETRIFYGEELAGTIVLGKGEDKEENVRQAVGKGIKALKAAGARGELRIEAPEGSSAHAAATAAHLALWAFNDLKTSHGTPSLAKTFDEERDGPLLTPVDSISTEGEKGALSWKTGQVYAEAQNWAREMMELPANLCTPTIFCERASKLFEGIPNVKVFVRDEAWAREMKMNSFLSVAAGSRGSVPPKFLEVHYAGKTRSTPISASTSPTDTAVLVGKGITFDTGGNSLKAPAGMKLMKGDMGGAATLTGALYALAKLGVEEDVILGCPLTENVPGGLATKPGDVVVAMNGKTIEIDNTDAEGRLVLADALYYLSSTYRPEYIVDSATLTGAMVVALGRVYTGVFTNDDGMWQKLEAAGKREADPFWRMPLNDAYTELMRGASADFNNISTAGPGGGACVAAAFLREFVYGLTPCAASVAEGAKDARLIKWAHLDIAGPMEAPETSYQTKGMTGRGVRNVVDFVRSLRA